MEPPPPPPPPPSDDLDDSINLESKVLLALSRLQKGKKASKKSRQRKTSEVSCKKVVEFLKANYSWLDGDIESQVLTALLSNVKTGIVCALENGQYRLVGPRSKNMASNCVTLTSHGPKCSCVTKLKTTLKTAPHICCHVKNTGVAVKRITKNPKKKVGPKRKHAPSPRRKPNQKSPRKSAKQALNVTGPSQSDVGEENAEVKCKYCFEVHPLPSENSKKKCTKNNSIRLTSVVPEDKFSPREELMSVGEKILQKI